jgi:hypothetical protein
VVDGAPSSATVAALVVLTPAGSLTYVKQLIKVTD